MYNSQYYTCEQIDERLLQGYLDDYNSQTGQSLTKAQFLTKLGSLFSKEGTIDNTLTQIGYYECDTAAGTAAKVINVASYSLFAGGSMKVKFVNKNTANNATLNINSQGAKALYYNGVRVSSTNTWDADEVVEIYYDGTSFYANNVAGGSGSGDGAFDISAKTGNTYESLSAALTAANSILSAGKKKGGMSIKFILRTNTGTEEAPVYKDEYVQYRLMNKNWSIVMTDWQGIDEEPVPGSQNLIKSGSVYKGLQSIKNELESIEKTSTDNNNDEIIITDNSNNNIVKIDENGVDAKALFVNGVPVITDVSDKASLEYVNEELEKKQDVLEKVQEETTTDFKQSFDFTTEEDEVVVSIDRDGLKAKHYYDINGNDAKFPLSNYDKKLTLFEPYFYSVKKGRTNNQYGEGTGWYDRFVICHISDTHQYNSLISEAIELSKEKCNIIINTGDDANGEANTPAATQLDDLNTTKNTVVAANPDMPYITVPGNHDVPNVTKEQYFGIMCALTEHYSTNVIWGDETNYRAYGYIDIALSNSTTFRIIMLDPFDYDDEDFPNTRRSQSAVFTQEQIDWFIATLKSAANNGYHVITVMHYSFGDDSLRFNEEKAKPDALYYQDPFMIPDIIDAFQNNTTLNKTYSDSENIDNIVVNEDFQNAGTLNYVCHLFGHIHSKNYYRCQKTDGSKIYNIAMFGEAALGVQGTALNKAYRLAGTVNDIACSLLAIDTMEKCVYRVSYGSFMNYDNSDTSRITKIDYSFNN